MFDRCFRFCTGETLEIQEHQELAMDSAAVDHKIDLNGDNSTMMLQPTHSEDETINEQYDDDEEDEDDDDDNTVQVHMSKPSKKSNLKASAKQLKKKKDKNCTDATNSSAAWTSTYIVTSSIYGQLLVVCCGAAFAAKLVTPQIPLQYFEAFYMYLYSASLLFLFYASIILLKSNHKDRRSHYQQSTKTHAQASSLSSIGDDRSHASIFLRIGAVLFGLGVMIHNGLEFGAFFEISSSASCYSILLGVNPILQAIFTFAQMYFIFTYSRIRASRFRFVARFGLMHLVATNICVWIRTLGKETLHGIRSNQTLFIASHPFPVAIGNGSCHEESIMGSILANASNYLYPFIVEFSLIGAAFLYVLWNTAGQSQSETTSKVSPASGHDYSNGHTVTDGFSGLSRATSYQNFTALYSCLGSSKGLFTGFLFLAISVTSLIIFFVLVHHPNYSFFASLLSDMSHSALLALSSIAILVGFCKTCGLKFVPTAQSTAARDLRDLLLRISAFGLYGYSLFGVIAGAIHLDSIQHVFVLITNVLIIVQVTLQTLFISDVVNRKRRTASQPGRQLITFLLITNLTLWIVYTFEFQKLEASPIQLSVYGLTTWAIILRITLPLSIFYRFYSAVTFAEVWKNSYKQSAPLPMMP